MRGDVAGYVYWGSAAVDVAFVKIGGFGNALNGVKFTLYSEPACGGDSKTMAAGFLLRDGKAAAEPNVVNYGLLNVCTAERKVILKKVNETFEPLPGAEFTMYTEDWAPYRTLTRSPRPRRPASRS